MFSEEKWIELFHKLLTTLFIWKIFLMLLETHLVYYRQHICIALIKTTRYVSYASSMIAKQSGC
jgi:hypothetical protein